MDKILAVLVSFLIIWSALGLWYFVLNEREYQTYCKEFGYDNGDWTECYKIEGNERVILPIHCEGFFEIECYKEVREGFKDER